MNTEDQSAERQSTMAVYVVNFLKLVVYHRGIALQVGMENTEHTKENTVVPHFRHDDQI